MSVELYHRNIEALGRHLPPETMKKIDRPVEFPALVAEENGGDINIDLGHTRLYADGAAAFAAGQVARFLAKPSRLYVNPPALDSDWVKGEKPFYEALIDRFGPLPDPEGGGPGVDAGALVSFGVGLGLHIPLLLKSIAVRDLFLAEQFPEFVSLSLRVTDWAEVIAGLEAKGGRLHLYLDTSPIVLAARVFEGLRRHCALTMDGSYGLRHYASPVLDEAHRQFSAMLPTLGSSHGFVEDECLMLRNAAGVMGQAGVKIAPPRDAVPQSLPAMIVGSGPSLDKSIDHIRRLRDQALLISGGTALSALLAHGLTPDLHCEVENVEDIHTVITGVADRYDIRDIPLLCPVTVDPRIPPHFRQVAAFFREGLTPTLLFGRAVGPWNHAGPTVTNLAMRAAVWAGARRVYLFGVDMGAAEKDKHHSDASYYAWERAGKDGDYWRSGANMDRFDIPVSGNFRETVFTNKTFLFNKSFFSTFAAAHPGISVHNCSDGARIEGTAPCPPQDLEFGSTDGNPAGVISGLIDALPSISAVLQPHERETVLSAYAAELTDWRTEALSVLNEQTGLDAVIERFHGLVLQGQGKYKAASACYGGTMSLMLHYAFAHFRRLRSEERPAFDAACREVLRERISWMGKLTDAALRDAAHAAVSDP
ncbi:6-hydroxymethylpterin diphosphokinase MptE-like protein [Hwanghaeella sp.]|uniref:motility associated factor glycosyltransferase family protein n=1 Tax=Hwanghaeella sp. TaxID=2605943 RepID=UPI003CCC1366